jgi:hypothetical protein
MRLRRMWQASSTLDADQYLREQQKWCVAEKTITSINESATVTLEILKTNEVSHPDERNAPWWPAGRPKTSDDELLETRRILLRSRAYDTGVTIFLRELVRREAIEEETVGLPDMSEDQREFGWLDQVLLAESFFGFNQMLAFARTKELFPDEYAAARNEKQTRLGEIAKLFGLSGTNRIPQFKTKKLMRFASVGFLTAASTDYLGEMTLELGPAGLAFFKKVYVPIINHMSIFDAGVGHGSKGG